VLEPVFRTALEPLRYYESAMHFHTVGYNFTYNEVASALLFVFGLVLWFVYLPRHGEPAEFKRYRFGES
jgi:hypothetical protein